MPSFVTVIVSSCAFGFAECVVWPLSGECSCKRVFRVFSFPCAFSFRTHLFSFRVRLSPSVRIFSLSCAFSSFPSCAFSSFPSCVFLVCCLGGLFFSSVCPFSRVSVRFPECLSVFPSFCPFPPSVCSFSRVAVRFPECLYIKKIILFEVRYINTQNVGANIFLELSIKYNVP